MCDPRILLDDRGQRSRRLATDVEPEVVEAEHEAVGGALRHAHREHARQAAADGELLVRIDQGVDQLADPLLRHLPEREHGVVGDRIPRQQRNRVRDEAGRQPVSPATAPPPRGRGCASAATGCPASPGRAATPGALESARRAAPLPTVGAPDTAHQRPVRAVFSGDDRLRRRG